MSNERIVFTNPDGSVSVIVPGFIPVENGGKRFATQAEMMAAVPAGASNIRSITTTELPADNRLYRNAWDDSNPEAFIGINVTKAQEIAHTRRRAKRDEVFAPHLDIVDRNSKGIPLKAGEDAAVSQAAMNDYKTNVDDVAQVAIDSATNWIDIKAAEFSYGIIS